LKQDDSDEELEATHDMVAAIWNGSGYLQLLVWHCVFAEHQAGLIEGLTQLDAALHKFINLRDRGLTQGGPQDATEQDIDRLRRLNTLVSQWLEGGELSPEIKPLARRLFEVLGGDVAASLPPDDNENQT
jgi:hypothetical protein